MGKALTLPLVLQIRNGKERSLFTKRANIFGARECGERRQLKSGFPHAAPRVDGIHLISSILCVFCFAVYVGISVRTKLAMAYTICSDLFIHSFRESTRVFACLYTYMFKMALCTWFFVFVFVLCYCFSSLPSFSFWSKHRQFYLAHFIWCYLVF